MAGKTNFLKAKSLTPYIPWCQDEVDNLGPAVQQFLLDQESYLRRWAHRWFENFQFIFGNTSVRWSRRYDFAVDVDFLRRDTPMNQRAATNISRVVAESLASMIYSNLPEWAAETANESSLKGKRFGVICEKLLDAYQQKLNCDREFAQAALMFVVFGQVAARVDWNPRAGMSIELPQWQKVQTPVWTDYMTQNPINGGSILSPVISPNAMGQPTMQESWQPITDQTGAQVTKKILTGDLSLKMLSPFEYRREIGSHGMHKTRFVEHIMLMDYDEFLDRYSDEDGKTKWFDTVQPMINDNMAYAFAVRHFLRMQMTTPPTVSEGQGFSRSENVLKTALFRQKVLVIEHFDRPNPDMWPEGRRVVVANGQCICLTTPQYHTNKMDGWHPFVEGQWMSIPPSSISSGPMDSVTAKNRELNVADSLIATALRRNMGSMMIYKPGGGFDPAKCSGEPGQMMPVSDPDSVRYLHDAQPISPVIEGLRKSYKEDVYDSSGAGDSLRGERSPNVSSGYAFQQLQEREERRLSPARKNFEGFASGIGEKLIACLRQNAVRLDDQTMGFMTRTAAGQFAPSDVVAFLSSEVDYGVDINIKPTSMAAKSRASQQATLMELAKGPAQMRIMQDAGVLDQFLKFFDAEKLRDKSSGHRDRANRENEIFTDMSRLGPNAQGITPPVTLFEDDDNIHIDQHTECLLENAEEFTTNEWLFKAFELHLEKHRMQLKEKAMEAPMGSTLQMPAVAAAVAGHPPPTADQIYQQTMMQAQMKAQQQAQQAPDNVSSSPRPKMPKTQGAPAPVGSGGPPQKIPGTMPQQPPSGGQP